MSAGNITLSLTRFLLFGVLPGQVFIEYSAGHKYDTENIYFEYIQIHTNTICCGRCK
jgi:hypothetical protein